MMRTSAARVSGTGHQDPERPGKPAGRRTGRRLGISRLKSALVELAQALRYGRERPQSLERIWVEPQQIRRVIIHPSDLRPDLAAGASDRPFWIARGWRGRVVTRAQFAAVAPHLRPLSHNIKLEACRRHWSEGVAWEATGVYESFFDCIREGRQKDECASREDVLARYARLDVVFAEVKAERRLRSQMELFPDQDRELGGIEIHIGPDGEPIFGDSGNHRLAMALVLGLPRIPAMLGFVHEDGLDHLARYRREWAMEPPAGTRPASAMPATVVAPLGG